MSKARKDRLADLTPEQRAKIKAIREKNRTPEARARHSEIRAKYQGKPGLKELIERSEVDPERISTHGAVMAMHKARAVLKQIREAKRLSLTEVAKRSGLALPALSRLESGRQPAFTFETLARYAAGVGVDLEIVVRDRPAENGDLSSPGGMPAQLADLQAELTKLVTMSVKRVERIMKPNQDIQPNGRKHGARVYLNQDGVVNVKQTIKRGRNPSDPYVVDHDRERFIDPGNDTELATAIREALKGRL